MSKKQALADNAAIDKDSLGVAPDDDAEGVESEPNLPGAPTRWYALGGVLAAALGAGIGQLVSALVAPSAGPVVAVGSEVINATPTPVKQWAVNLFGTADKLILIGSVTIVTLLLAAFAGVVARTRRGLGLGILVALAGLAMLAGISRPGAGILGALPGLVTAAVGYAAGTWFFRLLDAAETDPEAASIEGPKRRELLLGAGGMAAVAALSAAGGTALAKRSNASMTFDLPAPTTALPPLPPGVEVKYPEISRLVTPTESFYQIDTALVTPRVNVSDWSLKIWGMVDNPVTFTMDDILAMPMMEADITLMCVSNEVGGNYIGNARWLGVPTRKLFEGVGIHSEADSILSMSVDGMSISTPIEALTDDRNSLLAVGMNGEVLTPKHGYPARLVVPGLYGFVSATKWVSELRAITYQKSEAYWTKRGWAEKAPILTGSKIDTPGNGWTIDAGPGVIGGVAWAQTRGITKVEVQVDGGEWQEATLGPDAGVDSWIQWYLPWKPEVGKHTISVRATDGDGVLQTEKKTSSFPAGATGWHTITATAK